MSLGFGMVVLRYIPLPFIIPPLFSLFSLAHRDNYRLSSMPLAHTRKQSHENFLSWIMWAYASASA